MVLSEELKQFWENAKKEMRQLYENVKKHPLTCLICITVVVTAVILLTVLPYWRVTQFGITDPKDLADAENNYRATLAQILGGAAVGIGIYFAWGNLTTAREGQITERFTRAVDQLGEIDQSGNPAIEIRLGGVYALERIANESEKDYWPIMEILTAYVRKNSSLKNYNIEDEDIKNPDKVPLDIQAILTVIGRRRHGIEESKIIDVLRQYKHIDLSYTYLNGADFERAHFEGTFFIMSHLKRSKFINSHLEGANFGEAFLDDAYFLGAHLEGTYFGEAHLEETLFNGAHFVWTIFHGAHLEGAHFEETHVSSAVFEEAHLEGAHFEGANFKKINLELTSPKGKSAKVTGNLSIFIGAHLEGAHFEGAKNLTIEQLSKAKTLYNAKLDSELEKPLREKYPDLFEEPKVEP